jgi:hypothetical protein
MTVTLRALYGVGASVVTAIGAVMAFKPEVFFAEHYSFAQYLGSVLAIPLLTFGAFLLVTAGLLMLPGASAAREQILAWRDLPFSALIKQIRSLGSLSIVFAAVAMCGLIYETYFLARNLYSFTRDALLPQYRHELVLRTSADKTLGNLYAAKQGLTEYAERFKGHQSASEAADSVKRIDRMLVVKAGLVARARDRDKTFGVNRTSLHYKAEALSMHPWDFDLRDEIERDFGRAFKEYLPALLGDAPLCAAATNPKVERARLARHFVLLGFERASEAGLQNAKAEEWNKRFCDFVGGISQNQLTATIESIWQKQAIQKLLDENRQQLLEDRRRRLLSGFTRTESKWRKLLSGSGSSPIPEAPIEETAREENDYETPVPPPMLKPAPPQAAVAPKRAASAETR